MNYNYEFSAEKSYGFLEVIETTIYNEYFSVHVDNLQNPFYPEILTSEGEKAFYRTKKWVEQNHPEMLI